MVRIASEPHDDAYSKVDEPQVQSTPLDSDPENSRSESEFAALIEQVRAGSQEAAWTLVEKYGRDVQRFVRRTLHQRLRSKFDSLDFVQIVWGSFFRAPDRLQ